MCDFKLDSFKLGIARDYRPFLMNCDAGFIEVAMGLGGNFRVLRYNGTDRLLHIVDIGGTIMAVGELPKKVGSSKQLGPDDLKIKFLYERGGINKLTDGDHTLRVYMEKLISDFEKAFSHEFKYTPSELRENFSR